MPENFAKHGVVVLAAGASTRLGQSKQLLIFRDETLVHRAARLALETRPHEAVVVLGFDADRIYPQLTDLPIRPVDCGDWRQGLGASLRAGVDALSPSCSGVLVVLCDQPRLDALHLRALRDRWRNAPNRAAASFYAGQLGAPALLPRAWFGAIDAESDRGMRDLLVRRSDRIDAVANEALAFDIDLPGDLHHLS
ncbi:MAG: nucleotidyltransferase family protein [Rudaea sp.]|uniref:nucleotidyltransferase family protein n=1 Tax=unclassified Rudaea TaxID=2627037 RepID=UPI001485570A|nr:MULTISPECIES: nucleotidyltransferase family protein [unclassified Rudaea]MBN8885534.1 nucleotidyltransferase family protein [Rudaea sp.]MBR0346270.1 nucleotidyltransferase family protein [Rudaea sp.]